MGAGFVVYQELTRLDKAIKDGSFFENPTLVGACDHAAARLDPPPVRPAGAGGVHSHWAHLYALLELAKRKGISKVVYHAFTDGRDTPPAERRRTSCRWSRLRWQEIGVGRMATVTGRYYAMDRDRRWDRIQQAYSAIVHGEGPGARQPSRRSEPPTPRASPTSSSCRR